MRGTILSFVLLPPSLCTSEQAAVSEKGLEKRQWQGPGSNAGAFSLNGGFPTNVVVPGGRFSLAWATRCKSRNCSLGTVAIGPTDWQCHCQASRRQRQWRT